MGISSYDPNPNNNNLINGTNIAEGCPPANLNNAVREMMADLSAIGSTTVDGSGNITYKAPGTGTVATTVSAILSEKIRLWNYLSAAQRTDVVTQAGVLDCSAALQAAIGDAAGKEIWLPDGGLVKLSTPVSYVPAGVIAGQKYPGLKIFGSGGSKLIGPVGHVINIDTGVSFKFQDQCYFCDFDIDSKNVAGTKGIRLARAIRIHMENMFLTNIKGDAIFCEVAVNDADSSNTLEVRRVNTQGIGGWGFAHAPFAGANDLSIMRFSDCLFNSCGTFEGKAITGITKAANAVVTCPGHGFANGLRIRFGGVFGMKAMNLAVVGVVNVIDANSFSTGIDTSGSKFAAYTTNGFAFPAEPKSGSFKFQSQVGVFDQAGCTESKNVGVYVRGLGAASYRNALRISVENTHGISVICDGATGLDLTGSDIRSNAVSGGNGLGPCFGHVLIDATQSVCNGIKVMGNSLIANPAGAPTYPNMPHVGIECVAAGSFGGLIEIEHGTLYNYDGVINLALGDGWDQFGSPRVRDDFGKDVFIAGEGFTTTLTTASPIYTMDLRRARTHIIVLGAGSSGTLTIGVNAGLLSGTALNGAELNVIIVNTSGATVNLTYAIPPKSAPTTIANGATYSGQWKFTPTAGWLQSTPWI